LVDLTIEQSSNGILDDLNDLNYYGFTSASAFVGYVGSPNISANANLSTTIITNETLRSLLAKQRDF